MVIYNLVKKRTAAFAAGKVHKMGQYPKGRYDFVIPLARNGGCDGDARAQPRQPKRPERKGGYI